MNKMHAVALEHPADIGTVAPVLAYGISDLIGSDSVGLTGIAIECHLQHFLLTTVNGNAGHSVNILKPGFDFFVSDLSDPINAACTSHFERHSLVSHLFEVDFDHHHLKLFRDGAFDFINPLL